MRRVILPFLASGSLQMAVMADLPSVPYTTSSVQGSTIITNYYDPNAGPSTGPGLSTSPLDSRLNAPLGQSWNSFSNPTVTSSTGYQPFPNSTPTYQAFPNSGTVYQPFPNTTSTYQPFSNSTLQTVPQATTNYAYPQATAATIYPTTSTTTTSAFPQPATPVAYGQTAGPTPYPQHESYAPIAQSTAPQGTGHMEKPSYLYPGLVRYYVNKWVGSEYLFDLQDAIGVVVEVITPPGFSPKIEDNKLQSTVEGIFKSALIAPEAQAIGALPPLPFFHVLVFATTESDNYVFSVSGRLFEEVKVGRLDYKLPGTWQAITWEKQEFVLSSASSFETQLNLTVENVAKTFIDSVRSFRLQKAQQEEELRLRCEINRNAGRIYPPKLRR